MKKCFIVCLLQLFFLSFADASGCGRYDSYREIATTQFIKVMSLEDYKIESITEKIITLREKATDKKVTLEWEKTELIEVSIPDAATKEDLFLESFIANDILFEEGNGCGPVYRCVTGQLKMKLSNPKKQEMRTFSYPVINQVSSGNPIRYLMDSPLLPIFGNIKLDVASLKEENSDSRLNSLQCGHGNW